MKTTFLLAGILAATLSRAGDSAPFSLDTRTGIRPSRETEPLAYSTEWNGADSCSIALDGAPLLSNTTETGTFTWHTDGLPDGLHTLTFNDGVETLDAQFYVNPGRIVFNANGGAETMTDFTLFPGAEQTLPESTFTKDGHFLLGWALAPDGEATLLNGDSTADIVAEAGETVTLYAVWREGEGGGNGLSVKYYDISSSGYSTWSASETALTNYFAAYTPTIVANTLAFGETLDPGIAGVEQSSINRFRNWGLNDLRFEADGPTNRFHGKYANKNQENIAALLTGTINTETGGTYSFACIADDYEAIFIDGVRVCRSSWSSVGSGSIELSIGPHTFAMGFHEGDDGHGFAVEWKKPGDTVWSPLPQTCLSGGGLLTYAVRFDANGGEGTMAKRVYAGGDDVALPANVFVRDGWTFVGWATAPDGPVVYADGETVSNLMAEDGGVVTIYAVWSDSRVVFDANGGDGTMAPFFLFAGTEQTLPQGTFTKDGHFLLGWALAPDGDATLLDGDSTADILAAQGGTVTLYAVWHEVSAATGGECTTGGNANWFVQTSDTHDGIAAARSGGITFSQSSWLETTIEGEGTFSFWWKVSSEADYDFLTVTIDGVQKDRISGSTFWTQKSFAISGEGVHTIRWTYSEDDIISSGSDCGWVGEVSWPNSDKPHKWVVGSAPPQLDGFCPAYAVRFDANGGEGTMPKRVYAAGDEVETPFSAFSKDGFVFVGWATEPDGPVVYGETIEDGIDAANGATVTLYARWAQRYAVHFNANGGEGTMANESFWIGIPGGLSSNAFARTGYDFAGWATTANGEAEFADRALVTNLTTTANATANLYAVWEPHQYAVRFNCGAGTGSMANQQLTYDTAADLTPNAFTRTGYTFAGWATEEGGARVYNDGAEVLNLADGEGSFVNLYATWTPNEYAVFFNANGGAVSPSSKSVTFDAAYGKLPTPSREGYAFAGWTRSGSAVTTETVCTTAVDHTLVATWTANEYTVSFDAAGGAVSPASKVATFDAAYGALPTPTRTGYTFVGWTLSGAAVTAETVCTTAADHTLVATWTANEYTVSFDAADGTVSPASMSATFDSAYGALPTPTRTGYTFVGWTLSGAAVTAETVCTTTADHTLVATWAANEYTVSLDAVGGAVSQASKVATFDAAYGLLPTPTRTGYTFAGWTLSGAAVTSETICKTAADHTLVATWTANEYTVSFDAAGGSVSPASKVATFDAAYGALPTPTRTGYTFGGWTLSGETVTAETVCTTATDHTLIATWTANEYKVSFDAAGGAVSQASKIATFDAAYGELPTPTRTGYTFGGWTLSGKTVTAETVCTTATDHTLIATWTPNEYMVSFDANGGNTVADEKRITFDSTYGDLPMPTRTGYGFSGWTLCGNTVTSATICTTASNHVLSAAWTPNEYTVSFDTNGGNSLANENSVVFDSTYGELPVPTRTGYTFAEWTVNGNVVTTTTICTLASNHVLKASWTPNEYTVRFDAMNGTVSPSSKTVTFDAVYGELPVPTLGHHVFQNWLFNGEVVDSETVVRTAEHHTLVASWSDCMIIFDANGGAGIMDNQPFWLDRPATTISKNSFTRNGHYFLGWALSQDGEAVLLDGDSTDEIEAEAGETVTLYAVWHTGTKQNTYAVRLDANGGRNFALKRKGLVAKYYDIGSISDSTWYQRVDTYEECIAYHAAMTPTIVTNTADIGETLDFGDNNNSSTAFFHGKYRQFGTGNFVLLLEGTFDCTENGTYSFKASHDDGCVVYIDGTPAYRQSYATSGSNSFSVNLDTGEHEFVVAMHEGGGGQRLQFQLRGPSDGTYAGLPQSLLSRSEDLPVKDGATSFKRVYARGDDIELPAAARDGYTLAGWGPEAGGSALYPATGTLAGGIAANDGETAELHAAWTANEYDVEFDANGGNEILQSKRGLALKYYDISSSDYSTWSASEPALTNYFASRAPTIATNTLAFGESLDPGIAGIEQSSVNQFRSWGLNDLRFEVDGTTNRFHGKYAQMSQENISAILSGFIEVPEHGAYSFACIADDFEAIFIDGVRLCRSQWNTVGSGSVELEKGVHSFYMGFHEGDGGHGFAVQWKKPGETAWSPLPQSVLFEDYPVLETATFDSAYGPLPEISRTGYTFAGWTLSGTAVTAETICTTPSNHVLTAAWTPNEYTVSFDAKGGAANPASKGVTFDSAYGALPTPVREPYVFVDWRLDGAMVDAETDVTTPSNHVLSARWGIAVGNGVWEETICDEPISLGEPLVAPSGEVVIPAEIDGRPVVEIGADAFAGNTAITSISIPASVTNIAEGAFVGCTGLKTVAVDSLRGDRFAEFLPELAETVERVVFLDGVEAIPDNFFEGCAALKSMDIAESVAEIGTNVFEACSALATTTVGGLEMYQGWVLGFAGGSLGELAPPDLAIPEEYEDVTARPEGSPHHGVPYPVRGIAAGAFEGETGIATVSLPESLVFIGARAFANCTGLGSVTVPEGVAKIDRDAFRNCTRAQGLALPESLRVVADGAFSNCTRLQDVSIPQGVEEIGGCAFSNCWRVTSVSIPQSVERIGDGAFADCENVAGAVVPLHVRPMAELFPAAYATMTDAWVAEMDGSLGELAPPEAEGGSPGGLAPLFETRQMVPGMFAGCAAVEAIALPEWVRNVPDGAFEGCAAISALTFPGSVTNLGARACASMAALESVTFPAALETIGEEAFDGDSGIVSLALPDRLLSIGERAFRGLSRLARADIPASVREIGADAFAGCAAIRAISMPGDAGTVADAFPDAYASIVSATVVAETDEDGASGGRALPVLMDALFAGCAALTRVELPQDLAEIGASAFSNCSGLAEVGIPSAVTNIGASAFADCSSLSSIALPKSLTVLQNGVFTGCSALAGITIPEGVGEIGGAIFDGCTLLRSVRFVGNAPAYSSAGDGPYAGVPAGCVTYVPNGSTGWDGIASSQDLPRYWPAGTTYRIDWWDPNRLTISFDLCDGTAPTEVGQVTGTSYVLPAEPTRQGATFGGWWTLPENGARVTASTQVTAIGDYTVYAHWTMNRYAVRFDANGGRGAAEPFEMTVGTAAALPPCPFAYVGHSFMGWATAPDGPVVYADGATVSDLAYANGASVTLYAVWTEREWTLPDYLDAPELVFGTEGGEWSCDREDFQVGGASLTSGELPPSDVAGKWTNTVLRTTVFGEGALSFWWKVSCEPEDPEYGDWFDYATFTVDGVEVDRIAGESGWRKAECAVTGAGTHSLEWTFFRDDYDEDGADWDNALWVDGVEWTPAPVAVSFDAGGAAEGEAPAQVVKWAGYALVLPGPGTLADPPRVFAGWSDGENVYAEGETYVFGSADATLTAVWTIKVWTLGEAVDATALAFTTGGNDVWAVDTAVGWTNGVSAKSGIVANGQSSWIETTVEGAGTLAFRWKVMGGLFRNNPFAFAKIEVDGTEAVSTHLTDGWEGRTLEIADTGTHTVRWTYLRTSARACDGDCAWLDAVAWTPEAAESVIVQDVEIPFSWLDVRAASFVSAAGGDREAAARATAANGRPVWECYVADLDPEDPADDFVATIEMVDGEARVSILKGESADRAYETQGAPTPSGPWGAVSEESRFFRMKVVFPE